MRLTVVGCAGSLPSAASPASCYLVEHDGARLVLDLGNGSLGALQRHVDLDADDALTGVVLSHCHIDHCADAASLYVYRRHGPRRFARRLPLLGPADARSRLAAVYGMPDPAALDVELAVGLLGTGPVRLGPFAVESARVVHPVEAYAVRVTAGGRSLVYSGDTGPTPVLVDLARGADLALFEASFVGTGNPVDLHLTGADAGRAAAAAGVGRLVLTHLSAWSDPAQVLAEAAAHFDGPLELAQPGLAVDLDRP